MTLVLPQIAFSARNALRRFPGKYCTARERHSKHVRSGSLPVRATCLGEVDQVDAVSETPGLRNSVPVCREKSLLGLVPRSLWLPSTHVSA